MNTLISVIIPIMNAEKYLDECLKSVVSQTYRDIEIILVVADSYDGSLEKSRQWQKKDSRIRIICQHSGRLGTARNMGIDDSSGDCLAFIDADDWWDKSMLEKLYSCMTKNAADMVMCDRYNVHFDDEGTFKCRYRLTEPAMYLNDNDLSKEKCLIRGIEVSVNGKLYKKSLFTDNNILQPDCFGEDRAIMHYLVAKCKTVGRVKEALYYYRVGREGNSVDSAKTYYSTAECMSYVRNIFEKDNLSKKYALQLRIIERNIAKLAKSNLDNLEKDIQKKAAVLNEVIPQLKRDDLFNQSVYIWGSYGLRRSMQLNGIPNENIRYYSYSSIISSMSEKSSNIRYSLEGMNPFRAKWLDADIQKSFKAEFRPKEKDILLIDFMEERFDLLDIGCGYITDSELLNENGFLADGYRQIDNGSDEYDALCIKYMEGFVDFLKGQIKPQNVFLVKNHFAYIYGDSKEEYRYGEGNVIHQWNMRMDGYYDLFEKNFKGINVIKPDEDYLYTKMDFPYGCKPWHMNDCYYMKLGEKIEEKML